MKSPSDYGPDINQPKPSGRHHGRKSKREVIAERRTVIWDLMRSGLTDVRGLAKALQMRGFKVGKTTVHADIMATLAEFQKQRMHDVQTIVQTEVSQLDAMEEALAVSIKKGDHRSVIAAVRVKERRARLLGLDAPDQWAHEAEMRRMVTREQMLSYMRSLLTVTLESIEACISDEETRNKLRTTIANRFALVSGGRSGQDDPPANGGGGLVLTGHVVHPPTTD